MEKKDSIFAGVNPVPLSAPMPAPRPGVSEQEVADLKRKIDAMEKHMAAAPPPPPPAALRPPDMSAQFLLARIGELDKRLEEFTHNAMASSIQMKNIEESKISARREIEDLLKVVREQQKYSEMDRAMHDQLEKAWTRAEELEKKLMDFYSSVLSMETRRREDSSASSDKAAAAIESLSSRLASLEVKLSDAMAQPASAVRDLSARLAELDRKISGMAAQPEVAAAQETVSRELLSLLKKNAGSFKEVFDSYVRRELEILRDKFSVDMEAQRRGLGSAMEEVRSTLRQQASLATEKTAEFDSLMRKAEGIGAEIEESSRHHASAFEDFSRRLTAENRSANSDFAAALKKEDDERFSRFGAKYADALLSVTYIDNFRTAIGSAIDKLAAYEAPFKMLLKEIPPAALEKMMGVSGNILRTKIAAMTSAIEGLNSDANRLREIKLGVEKGFKDIFGNP